MQNNETKVNNILASALHSLSYDEIKELIYNLQERLPKEEERERGITITSLSSKETNLEQELEDAAESFAVKEINECESYHDLHYGFKQGATSDIAKKIHQKGMFSEEKVLKLLRFVALNYWLDRGTNEYVIVDNKEETHTETQILQTFLNQTK